MVALADALELQRLALMGHSWGGSIAVHTAAAHPDRIDALVLLDSGHVDYGALPDVEPDALSTRGSTKARARTWRWPSERAFADELAAAVQRWSPALLQAYWVSTWTPSFSYVLLASTTRSRR